MQQFSSSYKDEYRYLKIIKHDWQLDSKRIAKMAYHLEKILANGCIYDHKIVFS